MKEGAQVTDYLATRENPTLDEILCPSSQQSDGGANVVLFHKSSSVQIENLPLGSTVEATEGWNTDDGIEIDYHVWEEVPPPKRENKPAKGLRDLRNLITTPYEHAYDGRSPTLNPDTKMSGFTTLKR